LEKMATLRRRHPKVPEASLDDHARADPHR
jgi:hypothetical protein